MPRFGEQYAQSDSTGVGNISFAGNNEDTTTNLYDAQFREYGIQGRWPSPDPAGVAAANPANPQSWNRYAYAFNNPLGLVDPSGFCTAELVQVGTRGDFPILDVIYSPDCYFYTEPLIYGGGPHGGGGGGGRPRKPAPQPPCISVGPLAPGQSYCGPQKPKSKVDKVCDAIGTVGDFLGIAGTSASVSGTGSIIGTTATTGITELGTGGTIEIGALELTPIGLPVAIGGLALIGADLVCKVIQ